MRNKWFIVAVVVGLAAIVIAVVAAKLKDNGSDTMSTADWASAVCTDIGDWQTSITALATQSSGTPSKDEPPGKPGDAKTATDPLVSNLKDLGKPDLEAGDQLQQQLDSAGQELQSSYESLQSQAQDALSADTPAAFLQGLAKLAPQFGALLKQIQTTVNQL